MDLNPANWGLFLILTKFCHLYLDDVKFQNVKMALWSGHANIRDFSLKTDFMSCEGLPVRVVKAHVDQVDVTIPWKAWKSRGPEIVISDVKIVLETTLDTPQSSPSLSQLKEDALARFDSQVADLIVWVESVLKGSSSFSFITKSMVSTMLHNLKISILHLSVKLKHLPGNSENISKFVLKAEVDRISSFSTNFEFEEKMSWDKVFRLRKVEVEGLRITSKKKLKLRSDSEASFVLATTVMARTSLTAQLNMKNYDFIEFTPSAADIQISLTISPIYFRVSRRLIQLMWDIVMAVGKWELKDGGEAGNWKEAARRRWKFARKKVMESVRAQLMRRSIAYITRKLLWKEMYIKGYMLRLNNTLIPQNQIGFSHGVKDKNVFQDARFLSAMFYDLETLLSTEQILHFRREAVERHLLQVTGLGDLQMRDGKAQKKVVYSLSLRLGSVLLELFEIHTYSLRSEQHLQEKMKFREEPFVLLAVDDIRVKHESNTNYSPLLTIHNRFSHISTATRIDISSLDLSLTQKTPNFDAIKKQIFCVPARLKIKLAFQHRETESISIKFTESEFFVYPELLTAFQSFFSFCSSQQTGKYDREATFFAACRPSALFQKRSAIDFNFRLALTKTKVVVLSEYAREADAAILELVNVNIKGEKWPSDTVTTEVKAIRGFAVRMNNANISVRKMLEKAQRVFFTAYFSMKLFISTFRTLSVAVKGREARSAAMYKELKTPDFLVSVIAKELLFDLNGDQLKSLVSLAAIWKAGDTSDGKGQVYAPMDLDLTTKVLRRAAKQVKFSLELDCKGAVFNIVSGSGPYMKIIAHQFEASYKGKYFDKILLFQCQGVEILDTRSHCNSVLFAIKDGKADMDLIHKAELEGNGFRVDKKHALLVSSRSVSPESEDYRNIYTELQLSAASLHVTYNPNIIAATLKVFEPLWKSDPAKSAGFTEQSEAVMLRDTGVHGGEAEIINAKLVVDWGELVLNCVYEEKQLFTLYVKNVVSIVDMFQYKTQVRLDTEDFHCVDTSKGPAFNRLVLRKTEEVSHFAVNYKSTSFPGQGDLSLLQVRLKRSKLVYLHRVVMDIMSYVQLFFLGESDPSAPPASPMAIEILFSECEISLPRNSLSRESQSISIEKLTIRRNAGDSTTFDTQGLFEYEEKDVPASDDLPIYSSKQAARLRRERLKQSRWTTNSKSGLAEPAKVRDLHLNYEELRQLPDLVLKNLSVYYYKPENHHFFDGMRSQTEIKIVGTDVSPSQELSGRESSARESESEQSGEVSNEDVIIDMGRPDYVEAFTAAPDPAEVMDPSLYSLEDLIRKDLSTPVQSVESPKPYVEKSPIVGASNWKIVATNMRVEDSSGVELMSCKVLMVFMFSSSEAGDASKLQVQLEDDMNFYFPQRSYTFLLQTFLENMGELTTIPSASSPATDYPDSVSFQITLISKKASILLSTDPDPEEAKEGLTEAELAQLTWDSMRLTLYLMTSGEKKMEIEMDSIVLRDQRLKSLLRTLAAESPSFEAFCLYPSLSESDVPRPNLMLDMKMHLTGEKDIKMELCSSKVLIAPDFLGKVQSFFTAVFDPKVNPPPAYIKLPAVIPRASMTFELTLDSINFLLPSSYESLKSTILVIHTELTKMTYMVIGDAYNGPGSVKSQCQLKISHVFFSNFEQQQLDQPDPANILMMADLNVEYVMQKPMTSSSWIGEQIFVHFVDREQDLSREKEEERMESNWHLSVTISEIMKMIDISNCLTRPSVSLPPVSSCEPHYSFDGDFSVPEEPLVPPNLIQLPRKTSPDIPKLAVALPGEELRNISINLAIDKVLITILNKDIHPLLSLLLASVGCYQAQGEASSQYQIVINFTVHYFNQRTMAWEPAVESSSWDLDLLKHNGSTKVTLSSDINSTLLPTNINISYALIDLLGTLWKNWNQEIEGTELSSATPYRFINHTGLPLGIYTVSDNFAEPLYIEPEGNGEVSRRFMGQGKSLRFGSIGRYKIDIVVNQKRGATGKKGHYPSSEEFRKVKNVLIDTSDIHIMPLTEKFAHTDLSAYKRSASKRVKTLKLKDKIESFFIKSEQEQEFTDDSTEHQGSKCCSCLPCFYKGREEEAENQEQSNVRLLVVEVRWVQEQGYKEILIRSSLTLINTLSTIMIVEMTTLSSAGVTSQVLPGRKLYIPLPVVNYGTIRVRPTDQYDWSRPITLSALHGIVNEKEHKKVLIEGRFHGTESISLNFIPLLCNNLSNTGTVPFSCALDIIKKKNNTIRRKVSKDERYRWVPDKRMPNMGAKAKLSGKQTHVDTRDEESDLEDLGEEELIFQERELQISSIMSITNTLPQVCEVELSGNGEFQNRKAAEKGDGSKESESESISEGQTCHFYFRKFYENSSKIRIKLAGFSWSNVLNINFPKIKEEKKFLAKLLGETTSHKLFVWLSVSNDDFSCWRMTIFAPFWILNKSKLKLIYAEPDFFQQKREAKLQKDSEPLKESAAPDLFMPSGYEDLGDDDSKTVTRLQAKETDRRKSRKVERHLSCPHCGFLIDFNPTVSEYLCKNCGKNFAAEEGKGTQKDRDEKEIECPACHSVFTMVWSQNTRKDLKCVYCDAFIYKPKHVTMQPISESHDETNLRRAPVSAPGVIPTFQSKRTASVFSANKKADWSKFVIYSTSQMVTKLKVAMIELETKTGKNMISKWSDTFSLGNAGTSGKLSFNLYTDMKVDLGVRIDRGKGIFHRTNIITFASRYMLKCHNSLKLVCRQVGNERNFNIKPDEPVEFSWPDRHLPEEMSVALFNEYSSNLKWSGAFHIHEQGEFVIFVQNEARKSEDFILVSISAVGPTFVVQFQPQKKDNAPPYILRNYTKHQITFFQALNGKSEKTRILSECRIEGGKVIPFSYYYTLDEETQKPIIEVVIENEHKLYYLDELGEQEPLDLQSNLPIGMEPKHRKAGLLYQKRKVVHTYKRIYMEVSDGWMYRRKSEKSKERKRTSLLEECVKAAMYKNNSFFFHTCQKKYEFKTESENEANEWVEAIMAAKEASDTLIWQLIHVDIALDGATRIVSFRSGNARDQKKRHLPNCKVLMEQMETCKKMKSKEIDYEFQFAVSSVNISIIDGTPQETLLLSLSGVQVAYYHYINNYEGFQMTVDILKLDNQMMQNMWPVICAPFARKEKDIKKSVFISFSKKSVPQLDHIHYLNIYLQPIELRLEGAVLNLLLHAYDKINSTFFSGQAAKTKHQEKPVENQIFKYSYDDNFEEVLEMVESPVIPPHELMIPYSQKKLFIEELIIQPFCIVLSVNMNSPIDSPLPRMFLISLASIGLAITSIEAAEINMEGLKMYDMYQLRSRFAERLIQHYYSTCVFQVYKLLGAMEFLGNPANLLQTFKAGMKDAFVDPVFTLMRNPTEFIPELLKGGFGMVTNTIHGVFSSASKLAGGIGRSLALLTMDQQFLRARRNLLNRKVSSIGDGLMAGLKQLSYGLIDGVTSIVTSPMQGYRQKGVEGLFAGIGKGIVGTVVKPVSGLFDAFSATTSSLGKYARAKFKIRYLDRNRIPRHFHKDRILYPYDPALAQAQFLLYRFNPVYRHEIVIFFSELVKKKEKYVLIITKTHIFYMKNKPSASEKGKKFNRETIQDIKTQDYAKSLHIVFKDGKKLIIDCNWLEGEKDKGRSGDSLQDTKWKELTEICRKFGRDARLRNSEDDPSNQVV